MNEGSVEFRLIEARDEIITQSLALISEAQALYHERGQVDENRQERLETLKQSVSDDNLKIATIGEFSRGKSSLINALINAPLLPTAQEQTTAINCFLHGLNEEHTKPCIEVCYLSGKRERLDYSNEALEAWSTELNHENRDARLEVDRINLYTDHPLFQKRVTLIDTPGFQGILERHEEIARQAMDEAHVALWVQSTEQLGGNKSEWDFMKASVAKNFNRFITVINMWDSVLSPSEYDQRARTMSPEEWERSRLEHVRQQFVQQAQGVMDSRKIDLVTSDDHLFGVSAHWGLSKDPTKRARSNIQRLADRIEAMIAEGQPDKLSTPLRKLLNEHVSPLMQGLQESVTSLRDDKSLEDRQRELEQLELQIKQLEIKRDEEVHDTEVAHAYNLKELMGELRALNEPIKRLKLELDELVTVAYVRGIVERAMRRGEAPVITLSEELLEDFERSTNAVSDRWPELQKGAEGVLRDLAKQFLDNMREGAASALSNLSGMSFTFPDMDIKIEADLTEVIAHHQAIEQAREQIEEQEAQLDELELKLKQSAFNEQELQRSREERERAIASYNNRINSMGPAPGPEQTPRYRSSGWRGKQKFDGYDEDWSAHNAHQEKVKELASFESNERAALEAIKREWAATNTTRLSDEQAQRKLQQRKEKLEREIKRAQKAQQGELEAQIERAHRQLRRQTVRRLERIQKMIEEQAAQALSQTFEKHQELLKSAVEAHFMNPIREARARQEEVNEAISQGAQAREAKVTRFEALYQRAQELQGSVRYLIDEKIPHTFGRA